MLIVFILSHARFLVVPCVLLSMEYRRVMICNVYVVVDVLSTRIAFVIFFRTHVNSVDSPAILDEFVYRLSSVIQT